VSLLTPRLKAYIEDNKLCSEYLFADWEEFLELLYEEGGYAESVLWFEHIKISDQKQSLGSGGYKDKSNPDYMYAETHIFKNEMENLSLHEINNYIESIIASYPNNKLIPSFFIVI
jgi:hypothetical protein